MKIYKRENKYVIERDENTVIELTANEASLLVSIFNKDSLREAIEYKLTDMIGDTINIEAYEDGYDAFVTEIYECFEDNVEQEGKLPDDDEIEERILDEARYYDGMLIDD